MGGREGRRGYFASPVKGSGLVLLDGKKQFSREPLEIKKPTSRQLEHWASSSFGLICINSEFPSRKFFRLLGDPFSYLHCSRWTVPSTFRLGSLLPVLPKRCFKYSSCNNPFFPPWMFFSLQKPLTDLTNFPFED